MTISAFEMFFKIGKNHYSGGTIRIVHENAEIYLHYPWGSRDKATLKEIGAKQASPGYLPDHISFHRDGTIHTKAKNENKRIEYLNRLKPSGNIFNLPLGSFVPIYLETINLTQELSIEKRFRKLPSGEILPHSYWDLTGLVQVSIILVSKCSSVNPSKLLSSHGFKRLAVVGNPSILCDLFTCQEKINLPGGSLSTRNTDLLIIIVMDGWSEPAPQDSVTDKKVPVGVAVTMPPMELIAKMQKL
jgi:hypothetical protein